MLCATDWPLKLKGRVYRTCVRTVMTYGSETWAMKKDDEAVLRRAERAMIRRICGVSLCDKRRSDELEKMIGLEQNVITVAAQSRLRWYGHVMRREEDNGIRKVLDFKVNGVRPNGRPSLTWEALLKKDMKNSCIGVGECSDRSRWRRNVSMIGETRLPP